MKHTLFCTSPVCFQGSKAWFMCTYLSHSNNVLHCKNTLLAWLITFAPTLKYTRFNYYQNCVLSPPLVFEWWINKLSYFRLTQELENNCHLFMYSRKRSPWDCVIKLRDNRIFKALLWIKKSFKSIDFDLAKHALVSPPSHPCIGWVNFDLSGSYEITVDVFTVVIMYSYLFHSTKIQHPATHLDIHNF